LSPDQRLLSSPADGVPGDPVETLAPHQPQPGLSLPQITTIARAYWKQSVVIAVVLIALCVVAIKLLPKTYTAMATLLVNSESKDPLAAPQFANTAFNNYVATQMELMTSPVVLLPVVDRLRLTEDQDFGAKLRSQGVGDNVLREYAAKVLAADHVQIGTGRGGELIYIVASAKYPGLAVAIANSIADTYLAQERKWHDEPANERARRYSEELSELRAKVAAAQDKVTQFRVHNGITDANSTAVDVETQALAVLERQLIDVQNQRRELEAKQVGEQATADEALASLQVTHLQEQLSGLREQLASLDSTLGPRHPKVIALRSQMAETQTTLDRALGTLSKNTTTQLARVKDLEARLSSAVATQRTKILTLHGVEDQGEKMQVELDSAQAVYKRALDGYDQTLFASVNPSNNVSFISQATLPTQPSKPNKVKLLIGGAFASLLLSIALPMAYELLFRRRLRCRDDFERAFGIPVLAQFQAVSPSLHS
jgi:polysaccharide biosynthesis transport protein